MTREYAPNMRGQHFGLLTVIAKAESDANGKSMWICKCNCGRTCTKRRSKLIQGKATNCGCMRKHNLRIGHIRHGYSSRRGHDPSYKLWLRLRRQGTTKAWDRFEDFHGWLFDHGMVDSVGNFRGGKLKRRLSFTPIGPNNVEVM